MICLTGDLHHMTLRTGNQAHCDITEIQVAKKFLRLLDDANVKMTMFVSGRSFLEEWTDLRPICQSPLVELGGHNYNCFTPQLWHRFWNKVCGSYNGPAWYQTWEVQKTIKIIENKTGQRIKSWRNHMYMHGPYTERVLSNCGIDVCSDGVSRASNGPQWDERGVFNFPLNVMPDHEHLFHAERTPEWVDWWVKRYGWSDDYGSESYYVEDWADRVIDELQAHERDGVVSNMIIHPITMYLCDKFKAFERILDYIASRETVHVSELATLSPCRNNVTLTSGQASESNHDRFAADDREADRAEKNDRYEIQEELSRT